MSVLILASVTACGNSTATDSFCLIAEPIYGSKQDTEETRRQIDEHNAVGVKLCEW